MIVVYTTILAQSDCLKPAPSGADRAVLFSDQTVRVPLGWSVRPWPVVPDPRREAWHIRALSHLHFPDATIVIWADASFAICNVPRLLADAGDAEIAALPHPERSTCYEEGDAVVALGQSDARAVRTQLDGYRADGFAPTTLTAANVLVRRQTPRVTAFNERWAAEQQRWPDDNAQLSLDYCAWKAQISIRHLEYPYTANPYVHFDAGDHHARRRPYR